MFERQTFGFLRGPREHYVVVGSLGLSTLDACSGNSMSLNNSVAREKEPEPGTGHDYTEFCQMFSLHPSPRKLWVWLELVLVISEQRVSLKPRKKKRKLNPGWRLNKLSSEVK